MSLLNFDEATANLDAVTEGADLADIADAHPGRTTLLITHRLAALDIA